MKTLLLLVALTSPIFDWVQNGQHPQIADSYANAVDARGDHAMGISHQRATHHFKLLISGGEIEITAKDAADIATRDEIRAHLAHIAQLFAAGDFEIPMFIHDKVPPGVPVMKAKKAAISYVFEPMPTGGKIAISTSDPEAQRAIHAFLRFQIDDHRTGDSKLVGPPT